MPYLSKIKYRANLLKIKAGLRLALPDAQAAQPANANKKTLVRVVVYHGLVKENPLQFNNRFITVKQFEEHLIWYRKNASLISINDVFENRLQENKLNVAITFDDGYRNNYLYAVPLLKKYTIPAAFFITAIRPRKRTIWTDMLDMVNHLRNEPLKINDTVFVKRKKEFVKKDTGESLKLFAQKQDTNFISQLKKELKKDFSIIKKNKSLRDYRKLMSEKEIKKLISGKLFTIGIHGKTHASYTAIGIKKSVKETLFSKKYLESITGKKINMLAYPFGHYNPWLVAALYKKGFKHQLVCDYRFGKNDSKEIVKNRFTINPFLETKVQMEFLKRGAYT
ncbi:MAG: polysaccharide deacetylase family protein [Bacteroidota bacterium]